MDKGILEQSQSGPESTFLYYWKNFWNFKYERIFNLAANLLISNCARKKSRVWPKGAWDSYKETKIPHLTMLKFLKIKGPNFLQGGNGLLWLPLGAVPDGYGPVQTGYWINFDLKLTKLRKKNIKLSRRKITN